MIATFQNPVRRSGATHATLYISAGILAVWICGVAVITAM